MILEAFAALFATVVLTYVLIQAWGHLKVRATMNKIPGMKGLPFIGGGLELKWSSEGFFNQIWDLCRKHPEKGIVNFWMGARPMIVVFKADTLQEILQSSKHMVKGSVYRFIRSLVGDGLLSSNGQKWLARRKLITPTFHFKILEEFMYVFNERATKLVDRLDKFANGPAFDIQPYMYYCALDVICEAAMGVQVNAQNGEGSDFVRATYGGTDTIVRRMKFPWLWPDFLFRLTETGREFSECLQILTAFSKKVIRERRAERAAALASSAAGTVPVTKSSSKKRRLALLDMLLEESEQDPSVDDAAIQEEVDTFMFEGHDTTAAGSVWTVYMLGIYKEEQLKVQQEIDEVLGGSDRDLTMEDFNSMKYLDSFIRESLRLYPPVPWHTRTITEDCYIGGYFVPEGTEVMPFYPQLHRDPEFFPDPEKFDPGRWLSDEMMSRHPFCYASFSAGIRNCIGQRFAMLELKTTLTHILRKFTVNCLMKREDIVSLATLIQQPAVRASFTLDRRG